MGKFSMFVGIIWIHVHLLTLQERSPYFILVYWPRIKRRLGCAIAKPNTQQLNSEKSHHNHQREVILLGFVPQPNLQELCRSAVSSLKCYFRKIVGC
ncbi:MAG: hypothetical protein F6K08_28510 [Okeania sp. SIO1H6]|nr:hypothetical protein [Okeania sp. SIO1H6]